MAKEKLVDDDELDDKKNLADESQDNEAEGKSAPEGDEQEATLRSEDNESEVLDAEGNPLTEEQIAELRERRRKKRLQVKEKRREAMLRDKARIASLERQLNELQGKATLFEKRVSNQDIAQLDAGIAQLKDYIARANEAYAFAVKENNGEAAIKADEARYEARRRLEHAMATKQQMQKATSTSPQPQMDPRVVGQARDWMSRNRWYSPQGDDEDSAIALVIEKRVSSEGFDPSTPEYWSELDRRLSKRLPHRYRSDMTNEADDDDDEYDREEPAPRRQAERRPPTVGGARQSGPQGRELSRLPKDYVDQLKEAGLWDDPKKRAEMIKRYEAASKKYA